MRFASDDELLRLIGLDDTAAYQVLVERHIDRGYAVALRILGNQADAEDVVQDAFLRVWTTRGRWEGGRAKFSTWLYRVVANRCIDLRRRPGAQALDAFPEPMDDKPDQMKALLRHEVTSLLEAGMARLPDQQRVALILSYHENLSNAEIAEVMETTVSAVESLLKRGRQQLRTFFKGNGGELLSSFTDD